MSRVIHRRPTREAVLLLSCLIFTTVRMQAAPALTGGHQTPAAVADGTARLLTHMDSNQMLRLVIALKPPHLEEEQQFLQAVQTKGSPTFHKFLTPDEWNARFAPTADAERQVIEWAEASGLKITQRYPNRLTVSLEAPAATIEKAFTISLNHYQKGTRTFFSNDRDPALPANLSNIVQSVSGLNNLAILYPHNTAAKDFSAGPLYVPGPMFPAGANAHADATAKPRASKLKAAGTNGLSPALTSGLIDPNDIYSSNTYNYGALNRQAHCCNPYHNSGGAPVESSVGIATAYSVDLNDVAGFHTNFPFLSYNVTTVPVGGTPTCPSSNPGCGLETTMDTEWVLTTANSLGSYLDTAKVFVYEGTDPGFATFLSVYNRMLNDNNVRVVTTSWGCAENDCYSSTDMDSLNNVLYQMTGQGWTIVAASDDNGATGLIGGSSPSCTNHLSVDFPASSPAVIAAGGTTLFLNYDGSFYDETAWTGATYSGACAANSGGSGGGTSAYYAAPWYQQSYLGAGNRQVPDMALNASSSQAIYFQGSLQGSGGTSIVAPELAGFFAQENAYLLALGSICGNGSSACAPIGNAADVLYVEGHNQYAWHYPFYDITSGCNSNDVTAANGLTAFCAGTGYDQVTGWGTANMLLLSWAMNDYLLGDGVPPTTFFSGPATSVWYNSDQNVTWSVADNTSSPYPASGVAGFTQSWDAYPTDSYSLSTPGSANDAFYNGPEFPNATGGYLALSWAGQGCHTAYVRSWDNGGATNVQAYGPVCYDTYAPSLSSTASPAANAYGWYRGAVTVSLAASDPGAGSTGSGVQATYYAVDNAGCSESNFSACATYGGAFSINAQGYHRVNYFSLDRAGNYTALYTRAVNIDATAPTTSYSLSGTRNGNAYSSAVKVTLTSTDALSGVASVAYQIDGGAVQTYSAPFSISSGGNHTVVFHAVDKAGNAESTKSVTFQIEPGTQLSLATSANPAAAGANVTFTAVVSSSSGVVAGSVTFMDGSSKLATVALSGGKASFTTSHLTPGAHAINATFPGNSSDTGSSGSLTERIGYTTTIGIASSHNPSYIDQSVTVQATVSSASGTPTGYVSFKLGSTPLGTVALASGHASIALPSMTVGSHTVQASYLGAVTYLPSNSSTLTQVVKQIATTTALSTSSPTSNYRTSLTLTATVASAASPAATGSVTFKDGSNTLATITLAGGTASYTTTALALGNHSLVAVYSGDAAHLASTSAVVAHTVHASTQTTLTSSLSPAKVAQTVTFTALVNANGGTPTGTVTFLDGSTTIGSGTLSSSRATFATSKLAKGTHSIRASYAGATLFLASSSPAITQIVQ